MAEKFKINAKERDLSIKANALRKDGFIPGVIYSKGKETLGLVVDAHDFDMCYREAGGNSIVTINIEKTDGTSAKRNALIHQVALDPVSDKVLHTDFLQIRMDEKITTTVPLSFIGDSIAVIELSGSLLTQKSEVEIECLPGDLPHEIEIDIAQLADFDSVIHVSDIKVPTEVTILDDVEEVVAYVEAPRSEEEMEELEAEMAPEEMPPAEHGEEEEVKEGETPEDTTENKE